METKPKNPELRALFIIASIMKRNEGYLNKCLFYSNVYVGKF